MKILFRIMVIVLSLVLIASAGGTLYYYGKINRVYEDESLNIFGDNPKYHFSLILQSDDDVYWQEFKEGVFEAARAYNAAIELNPVNDLESSSKTVEYIDIATKSQVNGIIVNGDNTIEYNNALNEAAELKISIVLAGEEAGDSDKLTYVGTNFYAYGVQAAKLIAQIASEKEKQVNLAVILSSQNYEGTERVASLHSDIMLNGLRSEVDKDLNINLMTTLYRNSNLLGAEDLTRNILTQYQDINVIFCTNEKDSVAAARVIVERNLVGKVFVVATDVTTEITNYIDKGIIYGVLDRNGYEAGHKSVEMLIDNIGETFQSSYGYVDIDIYTEANISTYRH